MELTTDNQQTDPANDQPTAGAAAEVPPCPFCGKAVDLDDEDTLYPTGTGWKDDEVEGFRTYHSYREVPKEQWCWGMHCPKPAGGCGAEITGDSKDAALAAWSRRTLK